MKKGWLFLMMLSPIIFLSCTGEKGEGPIVTRTITIDDFSSIDASASFDVIILEGATQSVEATGHGNIIDRLKTDVSGGNWNIELQSGNYRDFELTITIRTPGLDKVRLSGSGDVEISNMTRDDLELLINGSGDLRVTGVLTVVNECRMGIEGSGDLHAGYLTAANAKLWISGSGDLRIEGEVPFIEYTLTGSGNMHAFDLIGAAVEAHVSGSGDCELTATDELVVHISGSGDVCYKGDPLIIQNITGSGKLVKK